MEKKEFQQSSTSARAAYFETTKCLLDNFPRLWKKVGGNKIVNSANSLIDALNNNDIDKEKANKTVQSMIFEMLKELQQDAVLSPEALDKLAAELFCAVNDYVTYLQQTGKSSTEEALMDFLTQYVIKKREEENLMTELAHTIHILKQKTAGTTKTTLLMMGLDSSQNHDFKKLQTELSSQISSLNKIAPQLKTDNPEMAKTEEEKKENPEAKTNSDKKESHQDKKSEQNKLQRSEHIIPINAYSANSIIPSIKTSIADVISKFTEIMVKTDGLKSAERNHAIPDNSTLQDEKSKTERGVNASEAANQKEDFVKNHHADVFERAANDLKEIFKSEVSSVTHQEPLEKITNSLPKYKSFNELMNSLGNKSNSNDDRAR